MRFALLLLLAFTMVNVGARASSSAAAIKIDLRSEVKLTSAQVHLSDLAEITTPDLQSMQKLMTLNLGQAPQLGQSKRLERDVLVTWVRRVLGSRAAQIQWGGANLVSIASLGQELKAKAIMQVAQDELMTWLAARSDSAKVVVNYLPHDLLLPSGEIELTVRPLREHESVQSRIAMLVDVWVGKRFVRSVSVTFEVSAFRKAWIAKQEIAAGQILQSAMFEPRQVDIAKLHEVVLDQDVESIKRRARTRIVTGQLLSVQRVEAFPLATKGELARLVMRAGDFEVESQVEVLKEGYLGQVIPVKGKNSNGLVMAKVVGEGLLEMKL